MENRRERIKFLTELLNRACRAYYQESAEIMSNYEYDALYDELSELEKEEGYVLSGSPTVNVGYEVISELPKETHEKPMLSLNKTKSRAELADFLGDKTGLLSWKLDGLTIVLTYENGTLQKAVTRGNGEVGEVVTNNAAAFVNIPMSIAFKEQLIVRGEAVIKYSDFERINNSIEDEALKYKNPRNLSSGSVRQLNSRVTAERNVNFYCFSLVNAGKENFNNSIENQLIFLRELGFETVEYRKVNAADIGDAVEYFARSIEDNDLPSDGLVLMYDDIEYGESLGSTAKFPRNGIAFKWADETALTRLTDMEWSPSRTGLINPVAIFEPVELEGSTVSRASVHNISVMESLRLGIGDEIEVYKANMIIPQIASNKTCSGNIEIPGRCPVCGTKTEIRQINEAKSLYCPNEYCDAKKLKKFVHFVSRDAMNIEGLSQETLAGFADRGYINEYADIFRLERYREDIINTKGFGQKSYDNLIDAINKKRKVKLSNLIYSLGIMNIGPANAKMICKAFSYNLDRLRTAGRAELGAISGIGEVIADSFAGWFGKREHIDELNALLEEIEIEKENVNPDAGAGPFEGKTFVITGKVTGFAGRNELKTYIESLGGKVTGSVTKNTDYLINNDTSSDSAKNKKAKELGIKIISEDTFINMAADDNVKN